MFRFDDRKAYRAPISFSGYDFDPDIEARYGDVTTMSFDCRTEEAPLAAYLPEGLEMVEPQLQIGYTQSREIDWMAGSAYNLVSVGVPVRYVGRRDRSEGIYVLVMWENHTVPILTGNLSMGIPKVFADIEDLHVIEDCRRAVASYEGHTFLELEMHALAPLSEAHPALGERQFNLIGWRYVPKIGGPGADLNQAVEFPQRAINTRGWSGVGTVKWTRLSWLQHPAHSHIISALADLPVHEIRATLTTGRMILQEGHGRALE